MQLLRMRVSGKVKPEPVIEPDCVDHQRVPFPLADGVSKPGGIQVLRMTRPIHENLAIAVDVSLEQEKNMSRVLSDPPWIGSYPWDAGGQAIGFGVILRHSLRGHLRGPGKQLHFRAWFEPFPQVNDEIALGAPEARQIGFAVRGARCRSAQSSGPIPRATFADRKST